MRLDTSQHLGLHQQMKLSPRIIQAMEILQLPMLALQERIEAELQSNPVLELREAGGDEPAPAEPAADETPDRGERAMVVSDDNGHSEGFQRLDDYSREYESGDLWDEPAPRRAADTGERDAKLDAMANAPAPGESLTDYLLKQWAFVEVSGDAVREAGRIIVNNIDDDGYLRTPLEELPAQSQNSPPGDAFVEALRLVQTLEPLGVGARDLAECLQIQLRVEADAGNDVSLELELVRSFLRDIEMNRLPQIARKTSRSIDDIKRAIDIISHLNPRPGSLIGHRASPVVMPDVEVSVDDQGEIVVTTSDGNSPHLYIAKAYRRMARDRGTERKARQFIQHNIRSAQWLIGAIEQRRHTVRRVVEEVFAVQREFLESGAEALRPLPMTDVARNVGVHVATVSRAVAGKYVQTPRGIFPLRMFFSGGKTTSDGDDVAWDAIRVKLKEVVDAEDKSNPLNDDELATRLSEGGITIARRTVAKYRKLLDIPPARKRRQY